MRSLALVALVGCNTLDEPGRDDLGPFATPTEGFLPTGTAGRPIPTDPSGVFGPPGGVIPGTVAGFPVAAIGGSGGLPVAGSGGLAPAPASEDAGVHDGDDAGR